MPDRRKCIAAAPFLRMQPALKPRYSPINATSAKGEARTNCSLSFASHAMEHSGRASSKLMFLEHRQHQHQHQRQHQQIRCCWLVAAGDIEEAETERRAELDSTCTVQLYCTHRKENFSMSSLSSGGHLSSICNSSASVSAGQATRREEVK